MVLWIWSDAPFLQPLPFSSLSSPPRPLPWLRVTCANPPSNLPGAPNRLVICEELECDTKYNNAAARAHLSIAECLNSCWFWRLDKNRSSCAWTCVTDLLTRGIWISGTARICFCAVRWTWSSRWFITGTPLLGRWRCGPRARRTWHGRARSGWTGCPRPASGARRSPCCTSSRPVPDASWWSRSPLPQLTSPRRRSSPCTPLVSRITRYIFESFLTKKTNQKLNQNSWDSQMNELSLWTFIHLHRLV